MSRFRSPARAGASRTALCLLVFAAASFGGALRPASAEPLGQSAPVAAAGLDIPFEKYSLPNGLEVILHQDRSLPLVAVNLWYHVGPANEPPGRSGFAHLFEHLMFQGSAHVGKEFDRLLESVGASNVNGTTSWDRTNYYETVPREELPLALWIESDRMGFLLEGLGGEELEVQRGVVKNERRQSYENSPYGPSTLLLLDTLFPAGTPYHGAIIGSLADLDAATLDDAREFFRAFYAPSNATLTLAGDFVPEQAKALIERYFAALPDRPRPDAKRTPIARPERAVRSVVREPVELARVAFGHLTPPAYSADDAVLEVAMAVLAGGKATRLYRELVVEAKVASEIGADLDSNALGSVAMLSATVTSGRKIEDAERALDRAIHKLGERGPTREELERAKRRILVDVLGDLSLLNGPGGESGRAGLLQRFNHYLRDPGGLPKYVAAIERVDAPAVQRVVREYLAPTQRVVVVTEPAPASAPVPAPAKGPS